MNPILTVASWEYNRFFKWKDVLKGLFWTTLVGALSFFGTQWLLSDSSDTVTVVVESYGPFDPADFTAPGITFVASDAVSDSLQPDATLTVESVDRAVLDLPGQRNWAGDVKTLLSDLRADAKREALGLSAESYADIGAGIELEQRVESEPTRSRSTKLIAGFSIFFVLMAVFLSFAYQFTAITGEKTLRITEQIVAAISPQSWMDGKILGISAIGITYVVLYSLLSIGVTFVVFLFTGGSILAVLASLQPVLVVTFLVFALLGILMWNAFMAAVAATIDDPNSSQRSGLMMLPIVPVVFAGLSVLNPDTGAVTFMSYLPLTSYAVMPAKMVLSSVAWWEPAISITLLAATAWFFRLLAGRIFRTAMMIHGKEPSYKEMWGFLTRA
jgi:ABC-2 type transport system permease protein